MKFKLFLLLTCLFFLSACSAFSKTPTSIPTIVLGGNTSTPGPNAVTGSGVTASGVVAADREAKMAFKLAGNVKLVNVAVGDQVQAGQLLVQLDDTVQQIQLEQANQALLELTSASALASTQQAVAQDQQDLNNAQVALNNLLSQNNNQGLISNAQAGLVLAQNALKDAQTAFDNTTGDQTRDPAKALAYQRLYAAQQNYDHAVYIYNLYTGKFNQSQMDEAKAKVAVAKAKLSEDRTLLAALTGSQVPENAAGNGYAQLMQARSNVQIAQADLDATSLLAPFSGEIGMISTSIGDYVSPGQIILAISDVSHMHIETTDLSERDVPKIKIGQTAIVSVKALNRDVSGHVTAISPLADTLGGDVVYKVVIGLDELPQDLRAGMSVNVQFNSQ